MGILSGFKKFKRYIRVGENYILDSEWTHAETVEMEDGSTLGAAFSGLKTEMADVKKSVADGKKLLAGSISVYVPTAADATWDTMNNNMKSAFASRYNDGYDAAKAGNASTSQVLEGKTFTSRTAGVSATGTMTDYSLPNKRVTVTPSASTNEIATVMEDPEITLTKPLTLPSGYHTGVTVELAPVIMAAYGKGAGDADARVNIASASYAQGVTDADARVEPSSASYQAGLSAGADTGLKYVTIEGEYGNDDASESKTQTISMDTGLTSIEAYVLECHTIGADDYGSIINNKRTIGKTVLAEVTIPQGHSTHVTLLAVGRIE